MVDYVWMRWIRGRGRDCMQTDRRSEKRICTDYSKALSRLLSHWKEVMIRRKVAERLAARRRTSGPNANEDNETNLDSGVRSIGEEISMSEGSVEDLEELEGEEPKRKPWLEMDKQVYEEQLEKLQEELVSTMLEKQSLQGELDEEKRRVSSLATMRKEMESLRHENKRLSERLTQRGRGQPDGSGESEARRSYQYGDSRLSVSTEDGFERVSLRPGIVAQRQQRRARNRSSFDSLKDRVFGFLTDFTEDSSSLGDAVEEDVPLTAKRLKDNVGRLAKSSKPLRQSFSFIGSVFEWKRPAESLVTFLIYMYCVWHGWLFPLLSFVAIIKLTLNYLHTSGLAEQFGFGTQPPPEESSLASLGISDKIHLVKQVAQTVQNFSGKLSDNLEKAHNLVLWHQPEATKKIYTYLWVFFIASLFLPNSYLLTAIGLGIGMKLFIIDNIYRKYPKVKERYDSTARMWASLPTDSQLLKRQSLTQTQMRQQVCQSSDEPSDEASPVGRLSEEDASFCTRFQLSSEDHPLPGWQSGGKRCTLLDRDRPLIGTKGGRLFLTHGFLCFEKSAKARDSDRFIVALSDIQSISKAKPFAVLPGSGMAIELILKSVDKPIIFGAILHRDQVYRSILDQGAILGLPWGTDPDEDVGTPPPSPVSDSVDTAVSQNGNSS